MIYRYLNIDKREKEKREKKKEGQREGGRENRMEGKIHQLYLEVSNLGDVNLHFI